MRQRHLHADPVSRIIAREDLLQRAAVAADEARVRSGRESGFACPARPLFCITPTRSTCGRVALRAPCQADLRVVDLQPRLAQVGAVRQRVGDQVLHRPDLVRRRDGQRVGGDDARAGALRGPRCRGA